MLNVRQNETYVYKETQKKRKHICADKEKQFFIANSLHEDYFVACLRADPGARVAYHAGHNVQGAVDVPAAGVGAAAQIEGQEQAVYQPHQGTSSDVSRRIKRVPSRHCIESKANHVQLFGDLHGTNFLDYLKVEKEVISIIISKTDGGDVTLYESKRLPPAPTIRQLFTDRLGVEHCWENWEELDIDEPLREGPPACLTKLCTCIQSCFCPRCT